MSTSFPSRGAARVRRSLLTAGALLALLGSTGVAAGAQAKAYGFLFLLGSDTLGIERVTPMGETILGTINLRGQGRLEWSATLAGVGVTREFHIAAFQGTSTDAPALQRAVIRMDGDTARVEISGPNGPGPRQVLPSKAGALMLLSQSAALVDLALARAHATPAPEDTFPVFLVQGGQTLSSRLRIAGDSAWWSVGPSVTPMSLTKEGTMAEAVVAAQNLRMRRVEGATLAAIKIGGPDYSAPAGAPYTATAVRVPAGDHEMAGTLTMPTGAMGRVPAVVTITGSGPQDRDEYIPLVPGYRPFRQLADTLGRHGFAVLRYDDRGTGESGGTFATATSADFANDVRAAVKWLRSRPDIDPRRIFLAGHSEGGLIAPMVAADDPTIAGIVLLAGPGKNGLDIIKFQQRYAIDHDTAFRDPAKRDSVIRLSEKAVAEMAATNPWMRFFFAHDPVATARRVKVPVLVAQGGSDQQVTAEQAGVLGSTLQGAGNRDVTVKVFPDLNHFFLYDPSGNPSNYVKLPSGHIGAEVMGTVVDWLVKHAGGGAR